MGNYRFGLGSSVYQGANRYSLDNIRLHQAKAEVKGDNFFLRYYTTIEEAGGSWDTRFAAWNINRAWKGDVEWFTQYTEGYLGTLIMGCPGAVPGTPAFDACSLVAHANGRALADQGRLVPGTPEFETERERITDLADLRNGSRFIDKTTLQHVEGNYNFNELIDFVDLQVGANWRMYRLNSEGTIFTDSEAQGGPIPISEFGAYVQAGKKLLPKDRLKLLASARYDKNQNFEGRISPRASFVFSLGENREHNVRGSFQTGFRNPDTQAQYIGLDLGVATLVGGAEENIERYSLIVPYSDAQGNLVETTVLGPSIYSNSYTASSATAYSAAVAASIAQGVDPGTAAVINAGILETASSIEFIKPERITSYEIGYKGVIERKLLLDVNFYYNQYRDFQANTNVVHVLTGDVNDMTTFSGVQDLGAGRTRVFQLYSNATGKVTSRGVGVSLDYSLPMNFIAGASWSHNRLDIDESADPNLIPGFNTPEHRINLKIGNRNIADTNISFMLNWRWLDNYRWEASFGNGDVDSYSVLDAQISYDIPNANTTIKLGGSNILNQSYRQAFGAAPVGAQYFISLTYNGVK
ncbi:MAG: TonB-dependent receptor [Bacteroidota bacterium]